MRVRSFVVTVLAGVSAVAVPAAAMEVARPSRPELAGAKAPDRPAAVPKVVSALPAPAPMAAPPAAAPAKPAAPTPSPAPKPAPPEPTVQPAEPAPAPAVKPAREPVAEKQTLRMGCIAGVRDGVPAVKCEWSPAAGAAHYVLFRKTADTVPERIWAGTDTGFVDRSVTEGTGYGYAVKAVDGAGRVIGFGGVVGVRCCADAPPPPEKQTLRMACVAGVRDGVPAVRCEWSPAAGAARYDLYRKTGDAAPEKLWSGTDTTFVDHTVALETAYGYGVKAIDGAGRVIGFGGVVAVRCCPTGAE